MCRARGSTRIGIAMGWQAQKATARNAQRSNTRKYERSEWMVGLGDTPNTLHIVFMFIRKKDFSSDGRIREFLYTYIHMYVHFINYRHHQHQINCKNIMFLLLLRWVRSFGCYKMWEESNCLCVIKIKLFFLPFINNWFSYAVDTIMLLDDDDDDNDNVTRLDLKVIEMNHLVIVVAFNYGRISWYFSDFLAQHSIVPLSKGFRNEELKWTSENSDSLRSVAKLTYINIKLQPKTFNYYILVNSIPSELDQHGRGNWRKTQLWINTGVEF